jgi:hypothetical protein
MDISIIPPPGISSFAGSRGGPRASRARKSATRRPSIALSDTRGHGQRIERGPRGASRLEHGRHRLRGISTGHVIITPRGEAKVGRSDIVVECFLSEAHPFKRVGDRDVPAVRAKDVRAVHEANFGMLGMSTGGEARGRAAKAVRRASPGSCRPGLHEG